MKLDSRGRRASAPVVSSDLFRNTNQPTGGSEPGVNIHNEDAWPQWRAKVQSQITAVDFSKDRIEKYELTNETLEDFLAKPREDWATCRWINGKPRFTIHCFE